MTGILLFLSPLPLIFFYVWIKKLLQDRRADAADASLEAPESKPYEPAPEPTPGFLLRRFNQGERAYLREQRATALIGFGIVVWFFFTMLGSSLLPPSVNGSDLTSHVVLPLTQPLARRVWFSFIFTASLLVYASAMIGVITAMTNGVGLLTTVTATLTRTRPITHRMRFWGRTLPAFLALTGGCLTGVGLVFALMLVSYGPVWRYLDLPPTYKVVNIPPLQLQAIRRAETAAAAGTIAPASKPTQTVQLGSPSIDDEDSPHYDDPDVQQARHIRWYRQSSPPRALLSILTTSLLYWSAFLFVSSRPFNGIFRKTQKNYWKYFMGFFVFFSIKELLGSHIKSVLFMYGPGTPPQVPPWPAILIPILLTTAFLGMGEFFFARAES